MDMNFYTLHVVFNKFIHTSYVFFVQHPFIKDIFSATSLVEFMIALVNSKQVLTNQYVLFELVYVPLTKFCKPSMNLNNFLKVIFHLVKTTGIALPVIHPLE